MAISATSITTGSGSGTSGTTASITPKPYYTYLLAVAHRMPSSTAANAVDTVSGAGLTWTKIKDQIFSSDSHRRVNLWWGIAANPSAGTVTFTFNSQSQNNINWCVVELAGADKASPIVQNVGNYANATSVTGTLASAFQSGDNATIGAIGFQTATLTAGSGFTKVNQSGPGDQTGCAIEFKSTNDTTVDASVDSTVDIGIIGVEIRADVTQGFF